MLRLGPSDGTPVRRVLAIGAHSDDLEIGCGGTILALCDAGARRLDPLGSSSLARRAR